MPVNHKLPFVGRIFWKVLALTAVLLVVGWMVIPRMTDYEITPADYGGSALSAVILAYLAHLWLLPKEDSPSDGE